MPPPPDDPRALRAWLNFMPPDADADRLLSKSDGVHQTPLKDDLIYKTYDNPPLPDHGVIILDDRFGQLADVVGEEIGIVEKQLRAEIAALRTEIEALKTRNVTPLTRKGRDAA